MDLLWKLSLLRRLSYGVSYSRHETEECLDCDDFQRVGRTRSGARV